MSRAVGSDSWRGLGRSSLKWPKSRVIDRLVERPPPERLAPNKCVTIETSTAPPRRGSSLRVTRPCTMRRALRVHRH